VKKGCKKTFIVANFMIFADFEVAAQIQG